MRRCGCYADGRDGLEPRVRYRAPVLAELLPALVVVWQVNGAGEATGHSDAGAIALGGGIVLIAGWMVGGVLLFRRARQRADRLPPAE